MIQHPTGFSAKAMCSITDTDVVNSFLTGLLGEEISDAAYVALHTTPQCDEFTAMDFVNGVPVGITSAINRVCSVDSNVIYNKFNPLFMACDEETFMGHIKKLSDGFCIATGISSDFWGINNDTQVMVSRTINVKGGVVDGNINIIAHADLDDIPSIVDIKGTFASKANHGKKLYTVH